MTAATDEAWIQNSIARLESLESQREQLAAAGQTDRLTEIDEEIRSLYEVLESVAGDGGGAQAPANAAAPAVAAAPVAAVPMAQPGMAQQPMAQPGMPAPMAQQPMGQPGMPAPMGQPGMGQPGMPAPMDDAGYDLGDDDIKPPRGPLPFILVGVLVIGGGIGAFMAMGGDDGEEAKPAPTGPATVIKAGAVGEDTQEPQVAKGADADRTKGTNFKESSNNSAASTTPRRSSSGSRSRSRSNKKSDDGRKVKFANSKDPLAGVQ